MKLATEIEHRESAVRTAVGDIKRIVSTSGVNRAALAGMLEILMRLAAHREFWEEQDFPAPESVEQNARYLIREDADRSYALYLNVMRPGKRVPPHNHTTWACVAAVVGSEHNALYRRLDDGSRPGYARIEASETVVVHPGSGIALMPDDIHSVEIKGNEIIRHLHMYGRALEVLDDRLSFDPVNNTCKRMVLAVPTRHKLGA
ncbi:MAG: cysteine dioxygenase family protein [Betaproteobacteria bacterium]|nr:cysteine dioxygenase family protein [Betaproteobacteria bacterium]